ncbi:hypothetical protein MY3296_005399 [Beauveria thailandica]
MALTAILNLLKLLTFKAKIKSLEESKN